MRERRGAPWTALLALLLAAPLAWLSARAQAAPPPAAGAAAPLIIHSGEDFGNILSDLSQRGPPLTITVHANISMGDVPGPRPVVVARNVTLRGAGRAEQTEINLRDVSDAWRLVPGVTLTLSNLTLSNLAARPPSAPPPPPANVSGAQQAGARGRKQGPADSGGGLHRPLAHEPSGRAHGAMHGPHAGRPLSLVATHRANALSTFPRARPSRAVFYFPLWFFNTDR
jgi:hypothetical protein